MCWIQIVQAKGITPHDVGAVLCMTERPHVP